jgi:hypothetical protein
VCDIGGGTGKYAKGWLTNSAHRARLVVIIDLPETLVYSEALLRAELGNDRVHYIERQDDDALPTSGAVLCPISNVAALGNLTFDAGDDRCMGRLVHGIP